MKRFVVPILALIAACSSTLPDYGASTYVVRPGDTLYTIAWRHGVDHRSLAAWNGLRNPDLIYVGQRLVLRPASAASRGSGQAAARRVPVTVPADEPAPAWQVPTPGPIVSGYGSAAAPSSGIGIAGRVGQPVSAAASGRVVYAGSGLIGYGQLVIIKHNETYLSAYGYNSRLFVRQGEDVSRGQKIAEMGLDPERRPRLHFEIRRNGVPVDPVPMLRSSG